MNKFLITIALFASSSAFAGTATFTDMDKDDTRAGVPNQLIAALTQAKVPFVKHSNGLYTVTVKNIRCDSVSNSPLDSSDPQAGVASVACRINAKPDMFDKSGKAIGQSIALDNLLGALDLGDCAMGGKCGEFADVVICSVDTKIEEFSGHGRFSCTVTSDMIQ